MPADELSRVFAALADPTRRDMVARLATGECIRDRSTSTSKCSKRPAW